MGITRNTKQYTAVVIGCGRIGFSWELEPGRIKPASHLGAFSRHPRVTLVGAAEVSEHQRELVAKSYPSLPLFSDAEEMLKKTKPDIVVIATMDDLHYPMVKLAGRYGAKLILCEKPIATNLRDARKAILAAKKSGSILLVNHMRRFDGTLRDLRQRMHGGEFGDIRLARALYVRGLLNAGTHAIDLLRWYLGDIDWVQGFRNHGAEFTHANDYNDDAVLHFKNGTRGVLQSLDARDYYIFEQQFYGTKSLVELNHQSLRLRVVPVKRSSERSAFADFDYEHAVESGDPNRSFFAQMAEHTVECLDGVAKPLCTGEDAMKTLEVLMAIRKSADKNGVRVRLK